MKKTKVIILFAILALLIAGVVLFVFFYSINRITYTLNERGITISVRKDQPLRIKCDEPDACSSVLVYKGESEEYKGFITISTLSDTDVDMLYEMFADDESNVTVVNKSLRFIEQVGSRYVFFLTDQKTDTFFMGNFSVSYNDKEEVLEFVKSIRIKQTEQVSPYPDDYSEIAPRISVLSSGEEIKEYCIIPNSWKNKTYEDLPSYQEQLKDKKVYYLAPDIDYVVFSEGTHNVSNFSAYTDSDESIFYDGAKGFRIVKTDEDMFYAFINAHYGLSGDLTYVFKCKFI